MTRRKFIRRVVTAGSAIVVGVSWLAHKTSPKRFVRALRFGKYPGELKPIEDTFRRGKWSG